LIFKTLRSSSSPLLHKQAQNIPSPMAAALLLVLRVLLPSSQSRVRIVGEIIGCILNLGMYSRYMRSLPIAILVMMILPWKV